jgi:hypothetical protein
MANDTTTALRLSLIFPPSGDPCELGRRRWFVRVVPP